MPAKKLLPLMALGQMLFAPGASAQANVNRARTDRVLTITTLSKQLRWHDDDELNQYQSAKDARTVRLLSEVDSFIADTFEPGTATVDQVRQGLDTVLGRKQGELVHNMAFSASLPGGRFLIAAVELERGGPR